MTYIKQNFENGDILHAEQLELIEDAIIDLQNKSIVGGIDVQINGSSIVNAGVANITQIPLLQTLTQAQYDAIDNPDPNTYYFIVGQ